LALTVLNVNAPGGHGRGVPHRSRGAVIPALLHHATLEDAAAQAVLLDPSAYPPFRLLLVQDGRLIALRFDGDMIEVHHEMLRRPALFTSSGLGDHLVEGPRRELFEETFSEPGDWLTQQEKFHRHSWPGRTHLSVCMRRADARTVSQTTVEVSDGQVS